MASKTKNSGGAATQVGINYQNRVAAWFCLQILANNEIAPLWNLSQDTVFDFLRCETEQPVDDILLGTSNGGHCFINVKHTVQGSQQSNSTLGSVVDQFVRQYISYKQIKNGERSWEREIKPDLDRLILVISPQNSSKTIINDLPNVLIKIREISSDGNLTNLCNTLPLSEKQILETFRTQLNQAWNNVTGTPISEQDELILLKLIWIEALDIDEYGKTERDAKNLLKSIILQDSTQSDLAWDSLIQVCANLASRHSGTERPTLRQILSNKAIRLKSARSYQSDINALRSQTDQTLRLLEEFSIIRVADKKVKIIRSSTKELHSAARNKSLVIVGEPGAGKSGALYDLADLLIKQKSDVIFFAVDRLEAKSIKEIKNELGLEHDINEVMQNWSGEEPAFLIIDALDAARSASAAQTFYDLISLALQAPERWRVIASIRKFDLRHHAKLRRLFAGVPPTNFSANEFSDLCHFNIPLLSPEEWKQIHPQSSELAKLIDGAEQAFSELLKVPFNLRLAGDLIGSGIRAENLSHIKTQIGLLDLYWENRVVGTDHNGDYRKTVLLRIVEAMINQRSLRANRMSIITDSNTGEILHQLLSSHILSEEELTGGKIESNSLRFAHHVLFDYSVSQLLFRGNARNLVETIEKNIDLVLAIRPSIVMYFQHLWLIDPDQFWDSYFGVIKSERIPEIGKLIAASVIVEYNFAIKSFTPLVKTLNSPNIGENEMAEKIFRHLTGALLVFTQSDSIFKIIGENSPPWCELLDTCTSSMDINQAYSIRPLLWTICRKSELFTDKQRFHAGAISRRLLEVGLSSEPRDSNLVFSGIETVSKTFESEPVASANILRKCLEAEHVRKYGHEELFHFAQQVERLIYFDPSLVEEIYIAAFTNFDNSEEKTFALGSRILPLTSTRQQDFRMAQFSLAHNYGKFLAFAPINATRVVLAAMNTYVNSRVIDQKTWNEDIFGQETTTNSAPQGEKFIFDGQEVIFIEDHSSIWDDSLSSQEDHAVQILNFFGNYLEELSSNNENLDLRHEILNLIVSENKYAIFWRRLIIIGTQFSNTLGHEIRSLTWTTPILTSIDTSVVIGNLIKAIFNSLTVMERAKIEKAVLDITESEKVEECNSRIYQRNRLLGCLNKDFIVSSEAKAVFNQLEKNNEIPRNDPPFSHSFFANEYTDEDYLKDQGVLLEDDSNRLIHELCQPVKTFAVTHRNTAPTAEEYISILPDIRSLYRTLTSNEFTIHEKQRDLAWSYLADTCSATVEVADWSCVSKDSIFIKNVLMECASHPDPLPDPQQDKQFDAPMWGPAARIDAASGLIRLARHKSCIDADLVNKIKYLALDDEVPAVRFQIATRLNTIYDSNPDLMWSLLQDISDKELSNGILKFVVNGPLGRLAGHSPDKVARLTKNIYERVNDSKGAKEVKKYCADIFLGLCLWHDQVICKELLEKVTENPKLYNTEAHQIVFTIRSYLNLGLDDLVNNKKRQVRDKAFQTMERTLSSTAAAVEELEKKNEHSPFSSWTAEDQEIGKNLAHLAESIGNQIYFSSGAYKDNNEKIPMDIEARKVYFIEAKEILNILSEFGYASLTHHLLETLEFFTPYAPKDIFLLIGKVLRKSKSSGYQYESLGADLVVKLIERFIAEFRYIFQEDVECRQVLIEILDIFVDAGWASARRLTYGVEDIFR